MTTETEITKKCPTCAATLVTSPEDLVITCAYCGETIDVDGKKIPNHQMLPSQESEAIQANVIEFLKKNRVKEGANIEEVKAIFLPYWVVPFSSSTQYYGVLQSSVTRYRTVNYRDAQGHMATRQEAYSVPVYRDEKGSFNRAGRENCIARKHTAFYGFDKFQSSLSLENIQPFDFQKIKKYGAQFVNAEVDANEAQRDAYGRVENENRSIAASKVNKLVRCDSQIQAQYPTYVHAPLWQARYKFDGKIFKVSAAGDSGKILRGEIPLTLGRRLTNLVIGLALLFAMAFLGNFGMGLIGTDNEIGGFIMIIIAFVVIVIGLYVASVAFRMQLEKTDKTKKQKPQKVAKPPEVA